jgi:acyl carrier protein
MDRIQQVFRTELDDDDLVIEPATSQEDIVDWDSLAHVRLVAAIEREFDIEFELSEIEQIFTVRDFVDGVGRRLP